MDSRNARAQERDDQKSAAASDANQPPSPRAAAPGQDSLLNAKFALAMTRALDNSKVDDNDEEQGIQRKETPDDTAGRTNAENASHAGSIRPGVVYHSHSKIARRPRIDPESEVYIDASESSDIPTSQRRSSGIYGENIATARLVEEEVQIREATLPVTGQLVVKATPVQQLDHNRRRRRAWYGGVAILIVLIAVVTATTTSRRSSKSTPPSESQPTSTAPIVYSVFTSTEQLYDAVDAYMLALREDESNTGTNTPLAQSNVSLTYGFPIGTWDVSRLTNFSRVFDPDRSATSVRAGTFNQDLSGWDVSKALTMEQMFAGAENFRGFGLNRWNVGRVQDFSYMFADAKALDADVSAWNTSSATTMQAMFYGAETFNGNLAAWDVANVESMARVFSSAFGFQGGDLTKWNVSKVQDMTEMFLQSRVFIGDISTWDTSSVTTMNSMVRCACTSTMYELIWLLRLCCRVFTGIRMQFSSAFAFDGNLSSWKVGKVRDMSAMFQHADRFQGGNLTGWNTSRVENMSATFASSTSGSGSTFTGDISTWDVSRVVSFRQAFHMNTAYNGDLSAWKTSSALAMDEMFGGAIKFKSDLSDWDTQKLQTASLMVRKRDIQGSDLENTNLAILTFLAAICWSSFTMPQFSIATCRIGTCPI
jgi:surface protein